MSALRAGADELLRVMDVFVREPLINWRDPLATRRQRGPPAAAAVAAAADATAQADAAEASTPPLAHDPAEPLSAGAAAAAAAASPASAASDADSAAAATSAFAQRKLQNARLKLSGAHPVPIVLSELRHNVCAGSLNLELYEGVLRDASSRTVGSCSGGSSAAASAAAAARDAGPVEPAAGVADAARGACLDAAEQVELLMRLATDPGVAGRCFVGLQLWL